MGPSPFLRTEKISKGSQRSRSRVFPFRHKAVQGLVITFAPSARTHVGFALHFYLEIMGLNLNTKFQVPSALVNELGVTGFLSLSHAQSP